MVQGTRAGSRKKWMRNPFFSGHVMARDMPLSLKNEKTFMKDNPHNDCDNRSTSHLAIFFAYA